MNAENSRLPTRARIASAVPSGSDRLTRVAASSQLSLERDQTLKRNSTTSPSFIV